MRIASITMIGQFPHGIDLHVKNLRWALTNEDHIFIITHSHFIETFHLINDELVTYIPFKTEATGFVNFWASFPYFVEHYQIKPEWFLLMEQDIWFFAKPVVSTNTKTIQSFLPRGDYRNIIINGNIHSRVWEGSQLIHNSIIKIAIEKEINFSFAKETFFDKNKEKYGDVKITMPGKPDTLNEFSLYCALEEKTIVKHDVKASHLRGPESMHRLYPDIYNFATNERLAEIQKEVNYVDIFIVIMVYYLTGTWKDVRHVEWKLKPESKKEVRRLLEFGGKWMPHKTFELLKNESKLWT